MAARVESGRLVEDALVGISPYRRIRAEIRELGLEPYVGELEMQGYTVIPPEMVLRPGEKDQLLELVLEWAERCTGRRPDLQGGSTHAGQSSGFGETLPTVLGFHPAFERHLQNPVMLAMATWLTGYSCMLNYMSPLIKGPGGASLDLHTDAQLISQAPGPLPPFSLVANCTLALTDYTKDNGCTVIVPGSHKLCLWGQGRVDEHPEATLVECPAGSLIVWHGNAWHGSLPRKNSGLRVALLTYYARHWLRAREDWIGRLPDEVLARNSERFRTLTGQHLPFGYATYDEFVSKAMAGTKPVSTIGQVFDLWT
jgi:Phytanoyl-CoA dioxygenase (PhyH)